jgi:hypothetical protein
MAWLNEEALCFCRAAYLADAESLHHQVHCGGMLCRSSATGDSNRVRACGRALRLRDSLSAAATGLEPKQASKQND